MPIKSFDSIKQIVIDKLKDLDPRLSYHNIHHTLDVVEQAERIAINEKIVDERELFLLKIAALYHDSGFLKLYEGHEELSCLIFQEDAKDFDLSDEETALIRELIMVTKITNEPHTKLEKILRDADLDYLGRPDFDQISNRLKEELLKYNLIENEQEWDERQLAFLKKHHYHTKTSQALREPVKQKNYLTLV
jgi:HD superfamily phosphodiesterase